MNEILFKNADERIIHIVNKLQEQIKKTHFENHVYLVGGCVRDLILNQPIKDIDIVVNIKGGGLTLANFLACKNKCWKPTNPVMFENYGTAKLNLYKDEICKDFDIELVQTRKEQYHLDSRNPETVFGTLEEDAKRRDLTINSLYYNISTEKLIDYNCGLQDIQNQVLRTPTDPFITFSDDPLRMLRCIRFSCRYGWGIEKNTWLGIIENAKRIKIVSKERIADELSKILTSSNASFGMRKLYFSGLLHRIMPDIYDMTKSYEDKPRNVTTFEHTMKVIDEVQPILEHRLAALFHDVGKIVTDHDRTTNPDAFSAEIAADDLKELKFSNTIVKAVETSIRNHRFFKIYADGVTPSDKKIRKFINTCGDYIANTLDLMNANNLHQELDKKPKQVYSILNRMEDLEEAERMMNVKLPVDGSMIMKEFKIKGGPLIGHILSEIKEAYFENPNITKDECFEIAEKVLHKIY